MLAHVDEVEGRRNEKGPMAATWQRLGDAAGAKGIGINRVRVEPGRLPTPPHSHGASEEIYYVLGGSGLLWQDEAVCEVRAGDIIVQVADHHEHTFKAGPEGLDYLVFGTRHPVEFGWLPRSNAVRLSWPWVEGRTDDPWDIEAQVGEVEFAEPGERPANVVALEDVPKDVDGDRLLGEAGGSERSGLNWIQREPGRRGVVPHCHSEESEAFVILEGSGTLELWPTATTDGSETVMLSRVVLVSYSLGTPSASSSSGSPLCQRASRVRSKPSSGSSSSRANFALSFIGRRMKPMRLAGAGCVGSSVALKPTV